MDLIPVFIVLLVLLILLALIVYAVVQALKWFFDEISGGQRETNVSISPASGPSLRSCLNCGFGLSINVKFCGVCGAHRSTPTQEKQLRELEITLRQLERLHQAGALDATSFRILRTKIETEREQILFPFGRPGAARQPSLFTTEPRKSPVVQAPVVQPAPSPQVVPERPAAFSAAPRAGAWSKDSDKSPPPAAVPKPPRKPFSEVLAAFMEQSNIRWGEIIGGLLIIGCSTALVISLWAQISRVPTIKFLIFTTVTAALFGIGFYTEHHWKLPTTSRGILTIATLLVPLNFLAIAAVSTNAAPLSAEVIVGELIAPAVFLCLVYFAARVITPLWPHLLTAGVLGSSVGQLLIRHFAEPGNTAMLILLGAFPVLCYVIASGWMLKLALADGEIDEEEATSIFITLGTLTFAAVLPFALLLYKSESVGLAMMHLAPLVTLAAAPMLATGLLLSERVRRKELVATRTAGASIAILGTFLAVAGMLLAWPNPASVVPAALFNFALFTAIAVVLTEPRAHIFAAGCLTLAFVVAFQVVSGHVPWQNLGIVSLLNVTVGVRTGQALIVAFVCFVLASEWWKRRSKPRDAFSYRLAACGVAAISLLLLTAYGVGPTGDPYRISAIVALYTTGAFWFAWREGVVGFAWAGSFLLFLTCAQICHSLLSARFPWLASLLLFAAAATAGAIGTRQLGKPNLERLVVSPLQKSATVGAILSAALFLPVFVWSGFEPASLFATYAFVLAAVLMGILVLSHSAPFFIGFQIASTTGVVLVTWAFLQRMAWYAFQPPSWVHPWALQVQGSILGLICLAWIAARLLTRRRLASHTEDNPKNSGWLKRILLDLPIAFDHVLAGALVIGFVALLLFGTASGISKELTNPSRTPMVFDLGGFPHELIFGILSLILIAILLAVMLGNLRERKSRIFAVGALVVLWAACPLVAGRFESQFATASAGRWTAAVFLLVASTVYAFSRRRAAASRRDLFIGRAEVLFLTLTPLILLTLSPMVDNINYVPPRGPQSGVFRSMGSVALYGVPLMLAVAALAIHAVRERSAAFMFAVGLLVHFTVTTVQIAAVAGLSGAMNRVVLVNWFLLNAIAAGSVALVWMGTRHWWMANGPPAGAERALLNLQRFIAPVLLACLIAPIALHLIAFPNRAGLATFAAGSFNAWLALLIAVAVLLVFNEIALKPLKVVVVAFSLIVAGSLAAFGTARFGVTTWAGFHVLLASLIVIPWLLLLGRDLPRIMRGERTLGTRLWARLKLTLADNWEWDSVLFATVCGAVAVLLALRGPFVDPLGAWWSIGALLSTCALAASLNWITFHRGYLYAAGILLNLAVSIWLIKYQTQQVPKLTNFVDANAIALSIGGVLWLWLELRARRRQAAYSSSLPAFHHVAAIVSLAAIVSVAAIHLHNDLYGFNQTYMPLLDALALVSAAILMIACLWDREAAYAVAGIYVIGLLGAANVLHHLRLSPRYLFWSYMIVGAAFTFASALLFRARFQIVGWAGKLKIPPRINLETTQLVWLTVLNSLIAGAVICLAFWVDLSFSEWWRRGLAAAAVLTLALMFGLLAEGPLRPKWQRAAIVTFLVGAVFLGWSFLAPGEGGTWLNRAVIVMVLMVVTVALFGLELDKLIERKPDWTRSFRDCVPAMTVTGILALAFVLITEIYYQVVFGAVQISVLALATVALTLAAAVVLCIVFALSPRHDPLSLSERRRGIYVYVAEITLVLLFMHIRLTMPWLFSGFFQRYWPLVILVIAYAGVIVSELFKRRKIPVIAQPMERTGAFLPLLPVIGFWIAQSQVEYSTLLFVVGGLYGLLSILRRSFWYGMAAALAGNAGLWYLLHETSEYQFVQHPQLWLIPVAISVLIAAHLNRKDFSEAQMTGIRYLCLITIYVSSTADIFINGVARSPWLPLVLAGLALAGVFAGIVFRIQAFLLLGTTFLLLAIATMINYASVNFGWTWLWYVAGIVTGALIITTFAVFEKKRADVLRVVDELKDWKG